MKKNPTFYGTVENGKLILDKPERLKEWLKSIGGLVVVTVEKKRKRRSLNQNNLLWMWYTVIGDEIGYTKEEVHAAMGDKFLKERKFVTNKLTGEVVEFMHIRSTTTLSTVEMMEYMSSVEREAAEMGITNLPDPETWGVSRGGKNK